MIFMLIIDHLYVSSSLTCLINLIFSFCLLWLKLDSPESFRSNEKSGLWSILSMSCFLSAGRSEALLAILRIISKSTLPSELLVRVINFELSLVRLFTDELPEIYFSLVRHENSLSELIELLRFKTLNFFIFSILIGDLYCGSSTP